MKRTPERILLNDEQDLCSEADFECKKKKCCKKYKKSGTYCKKCPKG